MYYEMIGRSDHTSQLNERPLQPYKLFSVYNKNRGVLTMARQDSQFLETANSAFEAQRPMFSKISRIVGMVGCVGAIGIASFNAFKNGEIVAGTLLLGGSGYAIKGAFAEFKNTQPVDTESKQRAGLPTKSSITELS